MNLTRGSRVLVTALDWGLGHATRTSAVVETLKKRGCQVTLAGSGRSLELLRHDHPELRSVALPSFSPWLSRGKRQWAAIGVQTPAFLLGIWRERRMTAKLVDELRPDLIISDNRYGVRDRRCASVMITHQLRPRVSRHCPSWVEGVVTWALCKMIGRFDGCLIPDERIGGLSGELSSGGPEWLKAHAIGVLSRLRDIAEERESEVEWLGIVSGPEPQRDMFEKELIGRLGRERGRRVVICGRGAGHDSVATTESGVEVIGHADGPRLKGLILAARNIVCRSGYSTIMDLVALGRRAELVATPGQAEQEYLAESLKGLDGWK